MSIGRLCIYGYDTYMFLFTLRTYTQSHTQRCIYIIIWEREAVFVCLNNATPRIYHTEYTYAKSNYLKVITSDWATPQKRELVPLLCTYQWRSLLLLRRRFSVKMKFWEFNLKRNIYIHRNTKPILRTD